MRNLRIVTLMPSWYAERLSQSDQLAHSQVCGQELALMA